VDACTYRFQVGGGPLAINCLLSEIWENSREKNRIPNRAIP
jgi:hypothetical protein